MAGTGAGGGPRRCCEVLSPLFVFPLKNKRKKKKKNVLEFFGLLLVLLLLLLLSFGFLCGG